jgi:hypothetical protein
MKLILLFFKPKIYLMIYSLELFETFMHVIMVLANYYS